MKIRLISFLSLFGLALTGCSFNLPVEDKHIHKFSDEYSYDETYHWHPSTCGHDVIAAKAEHEFTNWVIDVEPTIYSEGSKHASCSICGYQKTEIIDVLEHDHIAGEQKQENYVDATCTEDGGYDLVTYCIICNKPYATEHITISATGHLHLDVKEENYVAPSCESTGSYDVVTYCLDDNVEISRESKTIAALGHDYDIEEIEATFEHGGSLVYTCKRCGETHTAVTDPQLEHHYASDWNYDENKHWHDCLDDGYEYLKYDESDHDFGTWIIDKEAENGDDGSKHKVCSTCGYVVTEVIHDLEHVHVFTDEWSYDENNHWHNSTCGHDVKGDFTPHNIELLIEREATYDHPGFYMYGCFTCGYYYTFNTSQLEHKYEENWDCDDFYHWHNCTDEGYLDLKDGYAEHDFTDWVVDYYPTEETSGLKYKTCQTCGHVVEEVIPNYEHHFLDTYVYDDQYHWHICETCDRIDGYCMHRFGDWETYKAQTNFVSGSRRMKCLDCGYYLEEEIVPLEDRFVFERLPEGWRINSFSMPNLGVTITSLKVPEIHLGLPIIEIGENAFKSLGLSEINIPDAVTYIGPYAYYGNSFTSIDLPSSLTHIDEYAFAYFFANNLTENVEIVFPDTLTTIGKYAFAYNYFDSIDLPDSVISMGNECFLGSFNLTDVTLSDNLQYIGYNCFSGNSQETFISDIHNNRYYLKSHTKEKFAFDSNSLDVYRLFHANVVTLNIDSTIVAPNLFCNFTVTEPFFNLIDIKDDVKIMCGNPFNVEGTYSIKVYSYHVGKNVETWNPAGAFYRTETITVDADNNYFKAVDNVLFSKDGETLLAYPVGRTNTTYTMPNSVKTIHEKAFYRAANLKQFEFLEGCSLETIEQRGISQTGLTSIDMPDSIKKIETFGMANNYYLTHIIVSNNLREIGELAFNVSLLTGEYLENRLNMVSGLDGMYLPSHNTNYYLLVADKKFGSNKDFIVESTCRLISLLRFGTNIETVRCSDKLIGISKADISTGFNCVTTIYLQNTIQYCYFGRGKLTSIRYNGTREQWENIQKDLTDLKGRIVTFSDGTHLFY